MITSFFKPKARVNKKATSKRSLSDSSDETIGNSDAVGKKRLKRSTSATTTTLSSSSASALSPTRSDSIKPHAYDGKSDTAVEALLSHLVEESWKTQLNDHFQTTSFAKLAHCLAQERRSHIVYPADCHIFAALNACAFHKIKVVIVGQDPYHGPNQAHGLAFSVLPPCKIPPSLRNIYKELLDDQQISRMPTHGCLDHWARQGVLLLNTSLTVRSGEANSHAKLAGHDGWRTTTNEIIARLAAADHNRKLVFLLWGKPATETVTKALAAAASQQKHVLIATSHPSPLGATKTNAPFMKSKCFRKCNDALVEMGETPIDWNV